MNIVSFETAKRLKEAGFPQPIDLKNRPLAWYTPDIFGGSGQYFLEYDADGLINLENSYYAPCATELLPEGWCIQKYSDFEVRPVDSDPFPVKNGFIQVPVFTDSDSAEAAAMAWLYVNSKYQL